MTYIHIEYDDFGEYVEVLEESTVYMKDRMGEEDGTVQSC